MVACSKPLSKRRVDVVFKIESAIVKQIYIVYGLYGKSLYKCIFHARFHCVILDGDLLEARAENTSLLSGRRKILRKYVFRAKPSCKFLTNFPHKSINFASSKLKKKRHQIDSFLGALLLAGRPAARN